MAFKKSIADPSGTNEVTAHVRITSITIDHENGVASIVVKAFRTKGAFIAKKEPLWSKEYKYDATTAVTFATRFGSAPANNLRNAIEADILALPEWTGAADDA